MKKLFFVFALFVVICCPAIATAGGTAYIPYFYVSGYSAATDFIETSITVSNITNSPQNVNITLYNADGNKTSGLPFIIYGTSTPGVTGTDGAINFSLEAFRTVNVVLTRTSNMASSVSGFARITYTNTTNYDSGEAKALLSNVFIRDYSVSDSSFIYQRTITINGGNPF